MDELKPCPFCESTSRDIYGHKEDCYLRQKMRGIPYEGYDFVKAYNTRPRESALEARVAELESSIDANEIDEAEGAMQFAQSKIEELESKLANYGKCLKYIMDELNEDLSDNPEVVFDKLFAMQYIRDILDGKPQPE
jgi:hypothetical protein